MFLHFYGKIEQDMLFLFVVLARVCYIFIKYNRNRMFSFFQQEDNTQKAYERLTFKHNIGKQALKYTLCTMGNTNKKVCLCIASNQQTQSDRIGWFQQADHEKHIQKGTLKFIHISNFCDIEDVNFDPQTKILLIQTADSLIGNETFHFQNAFVGNKWFEDIGNILKKKLENSCEHLLANEQNNEISMNLLQLGTKQDLMRIRASVYNVSKQEITKYILVKEKYFAIQINRLKDENKTMIDIKKQEIEISIIKYQQKICNLQKQNKFFSQKIHQLNKQLFNTNSKLAAKQQEYNQMLKRCQAQEQKSKFTADQQKKEIQMLELANQKLHQRYSSLLVQIKLKKNQANSQQKEIFKSCEKKQEQSLRTQMSVKKEFIEELSLKEKQISELKKQIEIQKKKQFFHMDALQPEDRIYLSEKIEEFTYKKIKRTKLLCFFDRFNRNNLHLYIDTIPNICLVIRTIYGYQLAAFTIQPFQPFSRQLQAIEGGILISMTNKKRYLCKKGKRAITYDKFHINFGNSDILLQFRSDVLYSQFGRANGFYDNRGDKFTDLIGESQDGRTNIDNYEIYSVIFEQD